EDHVDCPSRGPAAARGERRSPANDRVRRSLVRWAGSERQSDRGEGRVGDGNRHRHHGSRVESLLHAAKATAVPAPVNKSALRLFAAANGAMHRAHSPRKAPMANRIENDTFGPIEVPEDRLWGAQTQRSLTNFRISSEKMPPALIKALAQVKRAAAKVNMDLGVLDLKKGKAMIQAADEVIAGKHDGEFPLA